MDKGIFLPAAALVALTLGVAVLLLRARFRAGFRRQVTLGDFRYGESERVPPRGALRDRRGGWGRDRARLGVRRDARAAQPHPPHLQQRAPPPGHVRGQHRGAAGHLDPPGPCRFEVEVFCPPCTSPRQPPVSAPRFSMNFLKSSTVFCTRALKMPTASPVFSTAPSGWYSMVS